MGFCLTISTAIAFCLVSILAKSYGELVVLRHPEGDDALTRTLTRTLTCLAENDGSALIWNYNFSEDKLDSKKLTDFQPKNLLSRHVTSCAIWNLDKCIGQWEEKNAGWAAVNSSLRAMAPVFDFRWEGFKEFVFDEKIPGELSYVYVDKVKESSGAAVFSARGSKDIFVFLCKTESLISEYCIGIILGRSNGTQSAITLCPNGVPGYEYIAGNTKCADLVEIEHTASYYLDAYEWRTFIIKWDSAKRTIKVFRHDDDKPFLNGTVPQWKYVPYIFVRGARPSRIRFHFYEYYLTKKKNLRLSTEKFDMDHKIVRFKLLVGLCRECQLKISLMGKNRYEIQTWIISKDRTSVINELQAWQSVELNINSRNLNTKSRKLVIQTILPDTNGNEKGYWAVDSFRVYESSGGMRESILSIGREKIDAGKPTRYPAKCQKLSYNGNVLVDAFSTTRTDTSQIREFIRGRKRPSKLGRNSFICDHTGCSCDREFRGPNCTIRYHVAAPTVTIVNDTAAIIIQKFESEAAAGVNISFTITEIGSSTRPEIQRSSPTRSHTTYEQVISGLRQDMEYRVRTVVCMRIAQSCEPVSSPHASFRINCMVPKRPEIVILSLKGHGILEMKWQYSFFNETNIEQFRIYVRNLGTNLQASSHIPNVTEIDYPASKGKMNYTHELHLWPSTVYIISIVAVSDQTSEEFNRTLLIPGDVAFARGKKLHVTHSGASIILEVPEVINATTNTNVTVMIKDLTAYARNQSRNSSSFANITEWLAYNYQVENSESKYVTIDCNQIEKVASNCRLRIGGTYMIQVNVRDWYTNTSAGLPPLEITLTDNEQNLTWLIIIPIVAIFLLVLFIWYRKHKKSRDRGEELCSVSFTVSNTTGRSISVDTLHTSTALPKATEDQIPVRQSTLDVVPYNPHSQFVEVKEFEEYTREAIASGLLSSQYEALPTGIAKTYDYGKLPENLFKNRYKNLIPYDDTRVILKKIPGDPYSDYINASYIKGYNEDRAYIATQGPLPHTVNDFWRMVWQEKVQVICMLTNVTEDGKTKCEQYWPTVGTAMKYGDLLVSNTDHEVFADYTIRTFNLSYEDKDRKVMHLHYTGWPDHGVPMYSQSLVAYLKKLLATPTGNRPIVVHCSGGIGRTGTIILCEICLRQAVREKILDVPSVVVRIREDRADMVNSVQQYVLAHVAITESMVYEQTQIPCNHGLQKKIKELRTQLPADIQRLKDSVWQDRALHSLAVTRRSALGDVANDRISELVPATPVVAEFNRDSIFDSESNYINAVSVDGVKMKKQYLASQLPSPFTLSEYWRLIAENRIELVLILQVPNPKNPTWCEIMSSDSILVPVPYIQVVAKSDIEEGEHFITQRLLMIDKSGRTRKQPVTVLKCTGWGRGKDGEPPTPEALVSLWTASEKISRKKAPTLVLCRDGVTGCGLYLALSFLLERMAVERECDVVSAVRAVRRSRTEFVQSLKQFDYLYDAAVNFFECFQTYANFS